MFEDFANKDCSVVSNIIAASAQRVELLPMYSIAQLLSKMN